MFHMAISAFFGIVFLIIVTVGMIVAFIVKMLRPGQPHEETEEETRIIQELYQGLSRLEGRVESLETLLLEKDAKEE